jgi:tRNA threonylcarbamoyladenosine biosynthesis protein TsaE
LVSWTLETSSADETRSLGECLGPLLEPGTVILLSGDLGAGKTCFTQGLGLGLEVTADEPVVSPSYTLMNHYRGRLDLYHFDFYRLSHADDLLELGFEEYLYGNGVTVVEWGDRFLDLTHNVIRIHIAYAGRECRRIRFQTEDDANGRLLKQLQGRWTGEGVDYD